MRNLLVLAFLLVFTAGCDDDLDDKYGEYITNESTSKSVPKSTESVGGISFSMDSVCRYIIVSVSEKKLNDACKGIVETLAKKDKTLEYKNDLGEEYGYFLSKAIMDSLAYYNYHASDIGTGRDKDIVLRGTSPYSKNNIWEDITVTNEEFRANHPTLFQKAVDDFFKTAKPSLKDLHIENQGGNFIEYNGKIDFYDGSEQYVHFTVANKNQKLVVEMADSHK